MLVETVSSAETAKILYRELGDLREWNNFLTDCRRNRQEISGVQLLPIAQRHQKNSHGGFRPIYATKTIFKFIDLVKASVKKATLKEAEFIVPVTLEIDETIHWKLNCYRGTTLISKRKNIICFRGFSNRVNYYPKQIH